MILPMDMGWDTIAKCNEYASKVFSCIMKIGSNIGPAAAGSVGPAPMPLK